MRGSGKAVLDSLPLGQKLCLVLSLVCLLAVGCQNTATPEDTVEVVATTVPEEVLVDRITYVGLRGNVFTISPDGTDRRRLTTRCANAR